mgnify:CR=1 FL=1
MVTDQYHFVLIYGSNLFQYLFCLRHNFRSDSVAGNAGNVQFHNLYPFLFINNGNPASAEPPAVLYDELAGACPLKEEISGKGFDMLIMRELTGGLYFGERKIIEERQSSLS